MSSPTNAGGRPRGQGSPPPPPRSGGRGGAAPHHLPTAGMVTRPGPRWPPPHGPPGSGGRKKPPLRRGPASDTPLPPKEERMLKILCLTYNAGTEEVPSMSHNIRKFHTMLRMPLGSRGTGSGTASSLSWHTDKHLERNKEEVDIYALGFQEVSSRFDRYLWDMLHREDPWTRMADTPLEENGYKRVARIRLLGIVLCVYVHTRHLLHVREVETKYLRLAYLGLKGSVAVRLKLYGITICFVNNHLTAHDWNLAKRVEEYNKVIEEMHFKSLDTPRILYHDYIFWMGDLNFRLRENSFTFREIVQRIGENHLGELLEQDQLLHVRRRREAFHELSEPRITFAPSYKFRLGSNEYNPKRRPAWTDRIFYRCNFYNHENTAFQLECEEKLYVKEDFQVSDHRPVVGVFNIVHFTKFDAQVSNVTAFGPLIKFDQPGVWMTGNDAHVVYNVKLGELGYTSPWDWIGLYKSNFGNLDSWLSYNYASSCRRTAIPKAVTFSGSSVVSPGKYVLLYIGVNNCILGMSDEFEVTRPPSVLPPIEIAEEALEGFQYDEDE